MSTGAQAPAVLGPAAIAAERRRGRFAAGAGLAALGCAIAAIVLDGRATRQARRVPASWPASCDRWTPTMARTSSRSGRASPASS